MITKGGKEEKKTDQKYSWLLDQVSTSTISFPYVPANAAMPSAQTAATCFWFWRKGFLPQGKLCWEEKLLIMAS